MIKLIKVILKPKKHRLGLLYVKYFNLTLRCDLCLYKNEKLWVRMPEKWTSPENKKSFVFWERKEHSDAFQEIVLDQLRKKSNFSLQEAIEMKKTFLEQKNNDTKAE